MLDYIVAMLDEPLPTWLALLIFFVLYAQVRTLRFWVVSLRDKVMTRMR